MDIFDLGLNKRKPSQFSVSKHPPKHLTAEKTLPWFEAHPNKTERIRKKLDTNENDNTQTFQYMNACDNLRLENYALEDVLLELP